MGAVHCGALRKSGNDRRRSCRNEGADAKRGPDQCAKTGQIRLGSAECECEWFSVACAVPTDEGGGRGIDDPAGQQVEVVLHGVHHHCVARVVAALQAHTHKQREINGRLVRFVWRRRERGQISVQVATRIAHHKRPVGIWLRGSGHRLYSKLQIKFPKPFLVFSSL